MDKDLSKKKCLADNGRYADLINGLLVNGQQQVQEEDLQDMDSQGIGLLSKLVGRGDGYRQLYRDLVRKVAMGVNFVVIGVENQELVHYLMPVRNMSYDAAEYDRQTRKIRKRIRKKRGISRAEWLSGFRKKDKLLPCITLVLYYGEDWDGARSLHELLDFTDISPQLKKYINDYPIHIFEIRKLENFSVFRTDLKQIFGFIKYSTDKKKMRQLVLSDPAYQNMAEDAYDMAVQYTNATELIAMKNDYEEGGKVNMCRALTEMLADERREGYEEGVEQGIEQGTERILYSLVNEGIISVEKAADELGISMKEFEDKLERYVKCEK